MEDPITAVDNGWHTWRCQWRYAGIRFWQDYADGAQPYFNVAANSLPDWPFNDPGYTVFPVFNLAVAGSGGGDPGPGTYPAQMLIDWMRVLARACDGNRQDNLGMPGDRELRASFDEVAADYQDARPDYPGQLYTDLLQLKGLRAPAALLEVGCGPAKRRCH